MKRYIRSGTVSDAIRLVDKIFTSIDRLLSKLTNYGLDIKEDDAKTKRADKDSKGIKVYTITTPEKHKCDMIVTPIPGKTDVVNLEFKSTESSFSQENPKFEKVKIEDIDKYAVQAISTIYHELGFEDMVDENGETVTL